MPTKTVGGMPAAPRLSPSLCCEPPTANQLHCRLMWPAASVRSVWPKVPIFPWAFSVVASTPRGDSSWAELGRTDAKPVSPPPSFVSIIRISSCRRLPWAKAFFSARAPSTLRAVAVRIGRARLGSSKQPVRHAPFALKVCAPETTPRSTGLPAQPTSISSMGSM